LAQVFANHDYYYTTFAPAIHYDGHLYDILDVLANQIGIKAIFSDWAATATYFANCFGLTGPKASDPI
jgi:glycerophosphoryl diester phosphodiesterase